MFTGIRKLIASRFELREMRQDVVEYNQPMTPDELAQKYQDHWAEEDEAYAEFDDFDGDYEPDGDPDDQTEHDYPGYYDETEYVDISTIEPPDDDDYQIAI